MAVDVPATVVDINDGFSVGLRAVASGARVLGTRGAGSEAGQRRRACMYHVVLVGSNARGVGLVTIASGRV